MILLPVFVAIKEYLRKYGEMSPGMEILCPHCGRRLRRHGRYFRNVVLGTVLYRLPIYRRFCPDCRKTFGLCPCFLRPYSHFALPVHEAAARLLVQGRSPEHIAERLCLGPQTGGVSGRTVLRWQRRLKAVAANWTGSLSERILSLSPGVDLTPYLPPARMPRGGLWALLLLGEIYRGMVRGRECTPLFPFLRFSFPLKVL